MPEQSQRSRGSKLTKPTVLATAVVLSAAFRAESVAAQEENPLPAGIYRLEMRDSSAINPFGRSLITVTNEGEILWDREGQLFALMHWTRQADTLSIAYPEGCPISPVGRYFVEHREEGGVQLKVVSDDCGDRASYSGMTWLRPIHR